ncbi:unnamed protein product, partial [Ectocarpus sp. 13 AM-2016]
MRLFFKYHGVYHRVPDTAECFPWEAGSTSVLEAGFDDIIGEAGSVHVSRTGDETATSAYGYTYGIDFAGTAVRGDMDLRLLIAQETLDGEDYASDVSAVVFDGLGESSNIEVTLNDDLDNAGFADAIIGLTYTGLDVNSSHTYSY